MSVTYALINSRLCWEFSTCTDTDVMIGQDPWNKKYKTILGSLCSII